MRTTFVGATAIALLCAASLAAFGQESGATSPDPAATAESLGLTPYQIPEGVFPVFPWDHLGSWMENYQSLEDAMKSMKECEFTLSGFVDSPEMAREAEKNGLLCIYEAKIDVFDERKLTEEEIEVKCAAIDERIKSVVEETRDLANVVGYNLVDEPGSYKFRALAAGVAAVKKYAPGKLAYINLFPGYASTVGADADSQLGTYSYDEYLERFVQEVKPQLLSYDNYMLEYSEDMRDHKRASVFFTDLFSVREKSLKYGIPFWYIGSSLCILDKSSPATPARYALQTYLPLAAGADGITWFLYYPLGWTCSPIDKSGAKTLYWFYMRDMNVQARAIGAYLASFRSTALGMDAIYGADEEPELPQFPAKPTKVLPNLKTSYSENGVFSKDETPKVAIGEFESEADGRVAALVVNMSMESSVKIAFDRPEGFRTLKTVSPVDGSETPVADEENARTFWIIPGHGALFVWEK